LCSSPAVFRFHAFANNVRLSVSSIAHAAHRQTNLPGPGMLSFAPLRGPSLAWHRLIRVVRVHNLYEPSRPSTFASSLNRACCGCLTLDNFRVTAPLSTQLLGCSNQCCELPRGRERVHAPPSTYPLKPPRANGLSYGGAEAFLWRDHHPLHVPIAQSAELPQGRARWGSHDRAKKAEH
jgi:hypothetical protein